MVRLPGFRGEAGGQAIILSSLAPLLITHLVGAAQHISLTQTGAKSYLRPVDTEYHQALAKDCQYPLVPTNVELLFFVYLASFHAP